MRKLFCVLFGVGLLLATTPASAGPIIIDGTDANDHGSVSGGANQAGWLYMQKALENLASQLGAGVIRNVLTVGLTGSQADAAFDSAFNLSALPGAGWTRTDVDGSVAIDTALAGLSLASTGLLYIPTYGLSGGDLTAAEMATINTRATQIANFVNAGGALFAMGESGAGAWGWLTTLIPGLVPSDALDGGQNITLTAAGAAAFPGLTNTDLAGADPWHNFFTGNLGSLAVLGTAPDAGIVRNVILGGGAEGTITPVPPGQIPEPASLLLLGTGAACLYRRVRRTKKA